jgi:hypothetical protein
MAKTPTPTEFTVRGTGLFPFDMLRYDSCWPKSQEDTAAIEATTRRRTRGSIENPGPAELTVVTLLTIGTNAPTEARWDSFGWKVRY